VSDPGVITLLSDFGLRDAFVGILKGVILGINPQARIVDLTHDVPPQDVRAGAWLLRSAVPFFPDATVHVAVVDPGVGSARRAILVETARGYLIGPDNGLLSLAAAALGRRAVRLIENHDLFRHPVSQTFHGRDIFAPVAAHLSRGVSPQRVGPEIGDVIELHVPSPHRTATGVAGEVVYTDRFGNLITNIDERSLNFPHRRVSVSIAGRPVVGPVSAYAAVPEGTALAIIGSWGMLEIAVHNGNAAGTFAAGPGTPVTVVVESRDT
jgi:hypothetical protein